MEYCKYLLCGLLIIGCLTNVYAKPRPDDHDHDQDSQSNDDYTYDDSESPSAEPSLGSSSSSSTTSTNAMSTTAPFFPEKESKQYAKVGDKNVTLQCNAKNLSESNVILWYKNKNIISTGQTVSNPIYKLSKNHNLIIPIMTKDLFDDYYCHIEPHNIRSHISLIVGHNNHIHNHNNQIAKDAKVMQQQHSTTESADHKHQEEEEQQQTKLEQPQAKTDEKSANELSSSSGLGKSIIVIICCYSITNLRI